MRTLPLTLLVALLLVAGPDAEAAVTLVQTANNTQSGDANVTFGMNTQTGNAVVVALMHNGGASGTYGISDATNGAYTQAVIGGSPTLVVIKHFRNITGGFVNVAIDAPSGGDNWTAWAYELNGADNSAMVQTGTNGDTGTSHTSSSTGLTATGFGVATCIYSGAPTTTAGSGWTRDTAGSGVGHMAQHQIAAFSSNTGPFTTGSSVDTICAMGIYPEAAAGGGARGKRTLLGVG